MNIESANGEASEKDKELSVNYDDALAAVGNYHCDNEEFAVENRNFVDFWV